MKSLSILLILSAVFVLFTGCASAPTEEEIKNADYGKPVGIATCISLAKAFIADRMKDPGSAQFRSVQCQRGWTGNVPIAGVKAQFGYYFTGEVNAKNLYGAYVGFTPFQGLVRDDGGGPRVRVYCITDTTSDLGLCLPQMVR